MRKTFDFGKIAYNGTKKNNLVTIDMELKENSENKPCFTASGLVWNSRKTDCVTGGQCLDTILPYFKDNELYNKIHDLWKRNHLNDMNAGTVEQTKLVNEYLEENNIKYDYRNACEYLKSIDKYEVEYNGKIEKYGHIWFYREISEEDLKLINEILNN